MNKFILNIIWIVSIFTFSQNIIAQKYDNGLIDKTIAVVGGDAIMLSELETEVQMMVMNGYTPTRCEVLENMLVAKLFINQAKIDSLTANPSDIERQLNSSMLDLVSRFGGQDELEKYFGKNIYRIRAEYKERIEENTLMQLMQQEVYSKVSELTPKQVKKFYEKVSKDSLPIIPTQYKISQILLHPSKERAAILAKENLLQIRQRILDGSTFALMATLYSEDEGTAMRGGELGLLSKDKLWPAFSDAAMSLREGQVSSIVETPNGLHLIQMIEKKGNMFNARHILIKPKYADSDKQFVYTKLDSIRNAIQGDSISFFYAARAYSMDDASKTNGGLLSDASSGSLYFNKEDLKPADYNVLKDMKVGDVSMPFETLDTDGLEVVYKIIKLEDIKESHVANIDDDFSIIQKIAKNNADAQAIDDFINNKMKVTYIVIDDLFNKCNFERSGWVK